jgi:hypothetical protein
MAAAARRLEPLETLREELTLLLEEVRPGGRSCFLAVRTSACKGVPLEY